MEEKSRGIRVIKLLKQVMDEIKQNIGNHFKEMKITGPQGMLMGILAHSGKVKISDLSEKLGLSNSTVSGIVDRLEKQGLVERVRSEEDRRVVYVSVTPEFEKRAKGHFEEFEKKFEVMVNMATHEEMDRILDGLSILKDVIERQKGNK